MPQKKPREIRIQEKLEHRILHGLACEWENALWALEPSQRNGLTKPLFNLRDMKSRWGYWSGEKNEICLNRDLVLNHSWDAVREILLHEMAHQLAEQVFYSKDALPHGPTFKKACFLLRANPKASGHYRPLDEQILKDSPNSQDRILMRVKKLMALAQSQNQHEADAAMAKAHELILKYNVNLLERDDPRHFLSVFLGEPALRHFREDYCLSNLLQTHYFVYGIWVPAYVMDKGKMGRVLEISGTVQNIRMAGYVHDFIKHFIDTQWGLYNREKKLNRYRKTDFAVGVIEGFRSKLNTCKTSQQSNIKKHGIIKINDPLLKEHFKYRHPHTVNVRGKALRNNRHIVKDGVDIGKKLVIYKGISKKGKERKLLS